MSANLSCQGTDRVSNSCDFSRRPPARAEVTIRRSKEMLNAVTAFRFEGNARTSSLRVTRGRAEEVFGGSAAPEYLDTAFWNQTVAPDHLDYFYQRIRGAGSRVGWTLIEYEVESAGGRRSIAHHCCLEEDGRFHGIVLDVSRVKAAEEDLCHVERRVANGCVPRASAWIADAEGRILYLSPAYCAIFGVIFLDVVGKLASETLPLSAAAFEDLARVARTGEETNRREKRAREDRVEGEFFVHRFPMSGARSCELIGGVAIDVTPQTDTERLLERSNERLRLVIRATSEAIWDWDLTSDDLWWGPGFATMFGWEPGEIGRTHSDAVALIHPEDRERFERSMNTALASGCESWTERYRHARKDGSHAHVLNKGFIVRDEIGRAIRMAGALQDVTREQEAEELLRKRERELRAIIDGVGPTMYLGVLSREGIVTHINEPALSSAGASPGAVIGKRFTETALWRDAITGRQAFADAFRNALQGVTSRFDVTFAHPGKTKKIVDLTINPALDEQKQTAFIVVSGKDVTERKIAESKLEQQAALLNVARDAIFVLDTNYRVIFWNRSAEQVYGWEASEVAELDVRNLLCTENAPCEEAIAEIWRKGSWSGEMKQKRRDGSEVICDMRCTLVRNSDGSPRSILVINTDITEKKKLEAQFLRAQRMESIGALAGGIAHDLNNVLAPIMMALGILRMKIGGKELEHILDSIELSAQRGGEMVKQVLSFARGAGGEHLLLQPRHVVRDLQRMLLESFPKNIRIEIDCDKAVSTIVGDPTQLQQVLMNLAVNARDAMPHGGTLTMRIADARLDATQAAELQGGSPGTFVAFSVTDTGSGIAPEHLPRMFEPFFTTKEHGKGTGLGLPTVAGIAKAHGGFVTVKSRVGEGSTFTVYLPASQTGSAPMEAEPVGRLPRGKGECILVVDDEAAVREITRHTLEAMGYEALTAHDGADGLAAFSDNQERIALVVTDVAMPVMDGLQMVTALRGIQPKLKVIVASGLDSQTDPEAVTAAGVKRYLRKPYTAAELLKTIREELGS